MDANAAGFDDPTPAGRRLALQRDHDLSDELLQSLEGRPGVPQNDDPRVLPRRVAEHLGEIPVCRDQAARLPFAGRRDLAVGRAVKRLLGDRRNIVSV